MDKDPEAGKLIVEQVPEFKNMMEEVAKIGASGAKKYIKHLESEIKNLEGTKEKYNEDQPEEENNYMEDGELDNNEEYQIEQQIEQEEQPAIKQIKNDIADDKFYIDRNGQKIKFYDLDDNLTLIHHNGTMLKKEKTNNTDIPIIYYI